VNPSNLPEPATRFRYGVDTAPQLSRAYEVLLSCVTEGDIYTIRDYRDRLVDQGIPIPPGNVILANAAFDDIIRIIPPGTGFLRFDSCLLVKTSNITGPTLADTLRASLPDWAL
jgi:hypothetical protein